MTAFHPGAVLGGRYHLDSLLGVGGMAEVWRGSLLGPAGFVRTVAIKVLRRRLGDDPSMLELFLDEARLAARLSHPSIVQLYELTRVDDDYFIVMELVDGLDLGRLISAVNLLGRRFERTVALYVSAQLLSALQHAHEACDDDGRPLNVIHRDVSPHNVLLARQSGAVKLADFGVARASTQLHHTESGVRRGTIAYMAPEQLMSEPATPASDLYAVGLIINQLLTGALLLRDREGRLMHGPVDSELESILRCALQRSPTARFRSARAMREAMGEVLRDAMTDGDAMLAALLDDVARQLTPGGVVNTSATTMTGDREELPLRAVQPVDSFGSRLSIRR